MQRSLTVLGDWQVANLSENEFKVIEIQYNEIILSFEGQIIGFNTQWQLSFERPRISGSICSL